MKTKLFGADTPEQRDARIRQLEQQIAEAEQQVKDATAEAQYVSIHLFIYLAPAHTCHFYKFFIVHFLLYFLDWHSIFWLFSEF